MTKTMIPTMVEENRILLAIGLFLLGFLLIGGRYAMVARLAELYRKFGIDVPDDLYMKQFLFAGVLLMALGFLTATGLIDFL